MDDDWPFHVIARYRSLKVFPSPATAIYRNGLRPTHPVAHFINFIRHKKQNKKKLKLLNVLIRHGKSVIITE